MLNMLYFIPFTIFLWITSYTDIVKMIKSVDIWAVPQRIETLVHDEMDESFASQHQGVKKNPKK